MNEFIKWRIPTQEEVAFIQKHWLPELNHHAQTKWMKGRVEAVKTGNFQVYRAKSKDIHFSGAESNDDGHIYAQSLDGQDVLSKKPGFPAETMPIDFPYHFTRYFVNKRINEYPVLLIKLPNDNYYLAVPAREAFK